MVPPCASPLPISWRGTELSFPNRIIAAWDEGGGKLRSSPGMITHSHIVLQFSDYWDTETDAQAGVTHWYNTPNSNRMWATSRSFLSQRAVGQVNLESVSSQPCRIKEGWEAKTNGEWNTRYIQKVDNKQRKRQSQRDTDHKKKRQVENTKAGDFTGSLKRGVTLRGSAFLPLKHW